MCRAHPRSRGEHGWRGMRRGGGRGSSPLARGTLIGKVKEGAGRGLIPARAGNTLQVRSFGSAARAHPRSRGEHLVVWVFDFVL